MPMSTVPGRMRPILTVISSDLSRPGLDLKTRHLVTIAVLAATGREQELELHIGASHNTGITPDEMREVLMQVAAYGGIPAANTAFGIARKIYARENMQDSGEVQPEE
jgi:alkylhydroperoxidase/carboxymuconolactone decarboxylase family protein YurZ